MSFCPADGLAEVVLLVGAPIFGQIPDLLSGTLLSEVDDVGGSAFLGQLQPFGDAVHRDHGSPVEADELRDD